MNIKWEDYKELKFLKGKLNKRYTKPIFLGEGKFGKVFKLEDLKLKRACALKVLSLAGLDKLNEDQKKDTLKQFRVEAEKYANCDHPNIVKIDDISDEDTYPPFLLLEFVKGKSLDKWLNEKGKLSLGEILRISKAILPALGHMHKKLLVHQDLKPSNIMLENGSNGRCVLVDFGITKDLLLPSLTSTKKPIGTPSYIPPEQWRGPDIVTHTADIYSFGVMLYEMVTGEVPFKGGSPAIMRGHLMRNVPQIKEKNPNAPEGVQKIIEKAMAKDPGDRYRSTEEFLNALKTLSITG